ncbi:hypothetical protein KDW_08130 [Dictyobacter vulcani]|uniref:Membrane transport protein MMPL domain-containing protein n=1 Tax=Dictyobacter vulcani TaxID=2607529 RepID=A0A5J4KKE3_9CHLR|nr:MMPL family transporter [Dictyobacter vulcani]GER86651.1 hypothetical protein KDW_08130 [Dictyobacter vulcani]
MALGLQRSGGIITSAAVIVIVVSACFATADMILVKALGLGMALAVVIDATLVRGLLVPATMRLLGDWNWWLPFFGVQRHPPSLAEASVSGVSGTEDAATPSTDSDMHVGAKNEKKHTVFFQVLDPACLPATYIDFIVLYISWFSFYLGNIATGQTAARADKPAAYSLSSG